MKKIFFIILASFFLFFIQQQAIAAPPNEQYRFQDSETIFGNGGEYAEQVIFRSNSPFKFGSAPDYTTAIGSTVGGARQPRLNTCYLPFMKLTQFNNEGTQAKLVIDGEDKSGRPCEKKIVDKFVNKIIQIDISFINNNPNFSGDLIPQRISVHVTVSTTAKGNDDVAKEFQSDEIVVEGPRNTSQPSTKETLTGRYTLNKKGQDAKDGYTLEYLGISDSQHAPGSYSACSKVAKTCVDFEKKASERANVEIRNDSIVINGVDKNGKEKSTLTPAPPPPCAVPGQNPCLAFNTAFGNISTDPGKFIAAIFGVILAISGAIALLLIARAGYKIMTSEGKPESIKEGRDQLIAAIVGLMLMIFSLVFLELIGVDILKIPCFNNNPCKTSGSNAPLTPQCLDVLQKGSSGKCVSDLQQFLNIPQTGNYDQATEDAVRKYQSENGLYSDGDAGPCTWGKLFGFEVAPVCSGPLDETSLRKFQQEQGLKDDGTFGTCTWQALTFQKVPDSCKK